MTQPAPTQQGSGPSAGWPSSPEGAGRPFLAGGEEGGVDGSGGSGGRASGGSSCGEEGCPLGTEIALAALSAGLSENPSGEGLPSSSLPPPWW